VTANSSLHIAYRDGPGGGGDTKGGKTGSNLSIITRSRPSSTDASFLQKAAGGGLGGPSPGGSALSIGTCHDLIVQPSTGSSVMMIDRHLPNSAAAREVHGGSSWAGLEKTDEIGEDQLSMVNRLRIAHSVRNITMLGGSSSAHCLSSELPTVRRSSAEEHTAGGSGSYRRLK